MVSVLRSRVRLGTFVQGFGDIWCLFVSSSAPPRLVMIKSALMSMSAE